MHISTPHTRTLAVELLGAAGSGKTTIARLLTSRHPEMKLGVNTRLSDCLPFFARDGHLLLPFLHREYWNSRFFRWYEARCMVRLSAWRRRLRLEAGPPGQVVLFDHGPLFKLVRLREFGPEFVNSVIYQNWWQRVFREWIETLDVVIWLDAPDAVLLQRIHARSTEHRMKAKSADEAFKFLSNYRTCYQQIVDECRLPGRPAVLHCNTEAQTLDQTVDRIVKLLVSLQTARRTTANVA